VKNEGTKTIGKFSSENGKEAIEESLRVFGMHPMSRVVHHMELCRGKMFVDFVFVFLFDVPTFTAPNEIHLLEKDMVKL
jgi:hypothetical protein